MRFSTVFISSAFVLAGMSAALAIERDDMLVARFASSDFDEIEARGFDEEFGLYARGNAPSGGKRNGDRPPTPPGAPQGGAQHVSNKPPSPKAPTGAVRHRRSYYGDNRLVARGNSMSTGGGHHHGDKERKDGRPPKYRVAKNDPPPHYEGSPHHVPHLDSFQTETDYTHNHKSPSHTSRHRRSFYDDLD